jgi:hypothetical protein
LYHCITTAAQRVVLYRRVVITVNVFGRMVSEVPEISTLDPSKFSTLSPSPGRSKGMSCIGVTVISVTVMDLLQHRSPLAFSSRFWFFAVSSFLYASLSMLRTCIIGGNSQCARCEKKSCNQELSETLFDTLIKCCCKVEQIQGFCLTSKKLNSLSISQV